MDEDVFPLIGVLEVAAVVIVKPCRKRRDLPQKIGNAIFNASSRHGTKNALIKVWKDSINCPVFSIL
jgi:hypothetical protein